MSLGIGSSEPRRITAATILLVLGVLLLLWAWGSWVYRANVKRQEAVTARVATAPEVGTTPAASDGNAARERAIRTIPFAMMVILLVLLVVLIGFVLISRAARRYFAALNRKRMAPTVAQDVWSQHRLPDEVEASEEDL